MKAPPFNSDAGVLIVGAGPSGLMLAHELARFNIPFRLIERDVIKSSYSRAIAVQIRTLEIFSALGLLSKLLEKSCSVGTIQIFAEGNKPINLAPAPTTSTFLTPMIIDQVHTEWVLEDRLKSLGVTIERGVELVDLAVTSTGVTAQLKTQAGMVSAGPFAFVVGADGAHSIVRKKMATSFAGSTYDDAFILADATCVHKEDHDVFRIFFMKHDFLGMIPMFGPNHYRLISVRKNERGRSGPEPTIDEFQKIADRLVPFPMTIGSATWVSRFFVQCRSASFYQDGRLFLVGDSAHIHSPAGGQGMNTGLQDAVNLAFKIALVFKHLAPENLLLTYQQERKPVGDFLIKHTDRLFKFMVRGSMGARLLRRIVLPYFARSEKVRAKIFQVGSQTAIKYKEGALCPEEHSTLPNIVIGQRMVNWPLINSHLHKIDLHQLASANFFTCFIFSPKDNAKALAQKARKLGDKLAAKYGNFLQVIMVFGSDFDAEKIMGEADYSVLADPKVAPSNTESVFVITRTDHHVFCAGVLAELAHADQALARWFTAQVKS